MHKLCICSEEHNSLLKYHCSSSDLKWSSMFGIMENAKRTLLVENYSITPTSLEHVFLSFTKDQKLRARKDRTQMNLDFYNDN